MTGSLTGHSAVLAIAGLAFVQIIVHLVFFLHMNTSSAQRWNVMAFGFTVLTAVILIVGSLWIMHNVSMNMMSR
jgi:cytochrome o ubiquinol oxidase operon protein cyoD